MAMNSLPLRHELKFFINEMQYFVLSGILDRVLHPAPPLPREVSLKKHL